LANPIPNTAVPLLRALLRHALLREYTEGAARAIDPNNATLRDAELVDLVRVRRRRRPGHVCARKRSPGVMLPRRLPPTADSPNSSRHQDARNERRRDARTPRLRRWMRLHTGSMRVTSLAHRRLTEMRT
jgi:hypothetical protein